MMNFRQYANVTKIVIPDKVQLSSTNFSNAFRQMSKIKEIEVPAKLTNMFNTFYYCSNLISHPICGDKVINMYGAYGHCFNLTGSPVCGSSVTDMSYTYF